MHNHLRWVFLVIGLCCSFYARTQLDRIEPPNWWAGMQQDTLQLLLQGEAIGALTVAVDYPGVHVLTTHPADSPNYLFVDLHIAADTRPGTVPLQLLREGAVVYRTNYTLAAREWLAETIVGFNSSDVVCLITPDRFANGDPTNDIVPDLAEKTIDRTAGYARHGGDIQGMIDHLDYLEEMGYTAIWPSPLLENNMPQWSYHGYAITDYYRVDPRFGNLVTYRALADAARDRGIKLIMDGIVNHCGSGHWWMDDLPFDDWLNYQEAYQLTNHRRTTHQDPYAARVDAERMTQGWFVPTMPDLNQRNPFLARYLIQNSIWWIETLGLGGIRQDTYPYPDADFLTEWGCAIMREYPNFSIVGEEWSYNPLLVAYWQQGQRIDPDYESCLKSTMDFPLQRALVEALREAESWDKGLIKLYEALSNDFIYAQPHDLMVFADNHDMDRVFTQLGKNVQLTKMALAYLTTVRGIPQLYYGTEVLLDNSAKPGDHGLIRTDFPGGWTEDSVDAFSGEGLTDDQREVQNYMRTLLNWRKQSEVIHHGRTVHFGPMDGVYVYSRYNDEQAVLVFLNKHNTPTSLNLAHYAEAIGKATHGRDIVTGQTHQLTDSLQLAPRSATILEINAHNR